MFDLTAFRVDCREIQISKWGKHYTPDIPTLVALIHSEASEVLEDYRNGKSPTEITRDSSGKPTGIPIEISDIIIRALNFASMYGINIEAALVLKRGWNRDRPERHGGKLV